MEEALYLIAPTLDKYKMAGLPEICGQQDVGATTDRLHKTYTKDK